MVIIDVIGFIAFAIILISIVATCVALIRRFGFGNKSSGKRIKIYIISTLVACLIFAISMVAAAKYYIDHSAKLEINTENNLQEIEANKEYDLTYFAVLLSGHSPVISHANWINDSEGEIVISEDKQHIAFMGSGDAEILILAQGYEGDGITVTVHVIDNEGR